MNFKLALLIACSVLAGCVGQENSSGGLASAANSGLLTEASLDSAAISVAERETLVELEITDAVPEEGSLSSVFSKAPDPQVSLKSTVGAYELGGYACNVVHNPASDLIWSINLYNLNDSLANERVIFGVSQNRKIQSVACTPDGSLALFSLLETKGGDYEIYTIDLVTNQLTKLTDNDTDDVDVSMDVNGLVMAWQQRLADGRQAITIRTYQSDRASFTQKGLASANPFVQPSLSPNGKWLALVQLRANNFLALRYDVVGSTFSTIKSIVRRKKLFHPSVSNDGNIFGWLENNKQNRYVVKNLDTNVSTVLLKNPSGIEHPFISFDGEWVVYSYNNIDKRQTFLTNIVDGETAVIGAELADPARYLATSWMGSIVIPQVLSLEVAANSLVESGGALLATVSRSGPVVEPLVVSLESSDTTELTVPVSVTFAVGETVKQFFVKPVDDEELDGTQRVVISASAVGADTVQYEVDVEDDGEISDELSITLANSSISEVNGSTQATVFRTGPTAEPLVVSLLSTNSSEATVPATVTILAGKTSVKFLVSAVQDLANDGDQTILIEASADGLTTGSVSLKVTDVPVSEVEETQVSLDASGNVSVNDIGDTTTDESLNISLQTIDDESFLQIQGVNGNKLQITQLGNDVTYVNDRTKAAVRIPVALVKSLSVDTKGGSDVIDMRADLTLPNGLSLIADQINILAASISTGAGRISLLAQKSISFSEGTLQSGKGSIELSANMSGDACLGTSGSHKGIELINNSVIKTATGSVLVKGCGGDVGNKNIGVRLGDTGGQILATGTGSLKIVGLGGQGTDNNAGVIVQGSTSYIRSVSGSVDVSGYGSQSSSGDFNPGVALQNGGRILSNASVTEADDNSVFIKVSGVGGKSANRYNHGLIISGANSRVHSEGAALAVSGLTAGDNINSSDSVGVYVNAGGELSSTSGAISIDGDTINILATTVATTGNNLSVHASRNILLSEGSLATEGGDLFVAANIAMSSTATDLSGSSCEGMKGSFTGIDLINSSSIISVDGDIRVGGCGGTTGSKNIGVRLGDTGAQIASSGSGNISIAGLAGQGADNNVGLIVQGSTSSIQSKAGAIDVFGAGSTKSTGEFNPGVAVQNGGSIVSSATKQQVLVNNAYMTVSGVGGISTNPYNHGVIISGADSRIHSENANLDVKGFTRGDNLDSSTSVGMYVNNGGEVSSTNGDIIVEGGTVNILATSIATAASDLTVLASRNVLLSDAQLSTKTGHLRVAANIDRLGTFDDLSDDICLGTEGNFLGIEMINTSSIKSIDGSVLISGCGGSEGSKNIGIRLGDSGGVVKTTRNGSVWIKGLGGKGSDNNIGVTVQGADSVLSSAAGSLTVMGYGSPASTADFNPGLVVQGAGRIFSTGNNVINLFGTGGTSPAEGNHGVLVSGEGSSIATNDAQINISATGGGTGGSPANNLGLNLNVGGNILSTGLGAINIDAVGGSGHDDNDAVRVGGEGAEIRSNLADITIRGVGSSASRGDGNKGVRVSVGGKITALSDASINIYGKGGAGGAKNQGIHVVGDVLDNIESYVSSVNGDIVLNGIANDNSTGNGNTGVNVVTYGFVETSGSGNIKVTGVGGNGGLNHYGVGVFNGGEIRTTGTGGIDVDGTGGVGNLGNSGLRLAGQLPQENPNNLPLLYAKISSAYGDINIKAQGGSGDGGHKPTEAPWDEEDHGMQGIYLNHGGWIEALSSASINIETRGGDGYNETHGLFMEGEENYEPGEAEHPIGLNSFITSINGDINIVGYGNTNNPIGNSMGVALLFGQINATGTGNINIEGTGGSGARRTTHGIQVNQETGQISTNNGAINLVGIGGVGTANGNVGVKVVDGGRVAALGGSPDATINIDGVGGAFGRSANHGVQIGNASSSLQLTLVEAVNGNVDIVGVAGGAGTGSNNFGVSLSGASGGGGGQILSNGSADLHVIGTGGHGINGNGGIQIALGDSKISASSGAIDVVGIASSSSTGEANAGIFMQIGGKIESTGSGAIQVHGTGGPGTKINEGIAFLDEGAAISSTDGEVIITAIAGDQAEDIRFYDPSGDAVNYIGGLGATGNLTLNIDSIHSVVGSIRSSGQLLIKPRSEGVSIGLGAGIDDGTLNISPAELATLEDGFSKITIGRKNAGLITLGALVSSDPMTLIGSNIEGITTSPLHINMQNDDTIILSGQVSPKRDTNGQSRGKLLVNGRVKFDASASMLVQIKGLNPGNAHDQMAVTGSVNLNSAKLEVELIEGHIPTPGNVYVIIDNDGSDSVVGTFAGLAEGATVIVAGFALKITYVGGDGNDVQLSF